MAIIWQNLLMTKYYIIHLYENWNRMKTQVPCFLLMVLKSEEIARHLIHMPNWIAPAIERHFIRIRSCNLNHKCWSWTRKTFCGDAHVKSIFNLKFHENSIIWPTRVVTVQCFFNRSKLNTFSCASRSNAFLGEHKKYQKAAIIYFWRWYLPLEFDMALTLRNVDLD